MGFIWCMHVQDKSISSFSFHILIPIALVFQMKAENLWSPRHMQRLLINEPSKGLISATRGQINSARMFCTVWFYFGVNLDGFVWITEVLGAF